MGEVEHGKARLSGLLGHTGEHIAVDLRVFDDAALAYMLGARLELRLHEADGVGPGMDEPGEAR